jgi:AcrR family transcriptional regulator
MKGSAASGRPNQKARTRKHLLEAAARLVKQGENPSLEEIAAEALVSRATAYRYFPSLDALIVEAGLDINMPEPSAVFDGDQTLDPIARLLRADTALHEGILANEAALRCMLAHSLQHPRTVTSPDEPPVRQNRRTPLIDAALLPARKEFKPAALNMLRHSLAFVIGTEALLVCKDVLRLGDEETLRVKRWAIRALVEAARKPALSRPRKAGPWQRQYRPGG